MHDKILAIQKERDRQFLALFCDTTPYIDVHGNKIIGRCRQLTAEEALNFQHVTTALIVEALS